MLGMREKVEAPADGANKPDHHTYYGEHKMGDERREKQRQAKSRDDRPSGWRRELDEVFGFGGIVLHGQ
jgi:hypothetical protein